MAIARKLVDYIQKSMLTSVYLDGFGVGAGMSKSCCGPLFILSYGNPRMSISLKNDSLKKTQDSVYTPFVEHSPISS